MRMLYRGIPTMGLLGLGGLLLGGLMNAFGGGVGGDAPAPRVQNPSAAPLPPRVIPARELWRAGELEGEGELVLGIIQDVLVDEVGNSYLLDQQFNEVRVFSPTGRPLRSHFALRTPRCLRERGIKGVRATSHIACRPAKPLP